MKTKDQAAKTTGKGVQRKGKKPASAGSTPSTFGRDKIREEAVGGQIGTIDQQGGSTMKKLYRVESKANGVEHRGLDYNDVSIGLDYNDVSIQWIRTDRDFPLLRLEEAFEGYDQLSSWERSFALDVLDDLFSEEEAKALAEYLSQLPEITMTTVTEVPLPLVLYEALGIRYRHDCDDDRWQGRLWPNKNDQNALPLPFMVSGRYHMEEGKVSQPCPVCGQRFVVGREVHEPLEELPVVRKRSRTH